MSADFTAIIGFEKERVDIQAFYKDLVRGIGFQSLYDCIRELKKLNPQSKWGDAWSFEDKDGCIEISGMGGISFVFSEHCCMIQHYLHWISFILDDVGINYQSRLRDICCEIATYFRSTFAIYFPDSASKSSLIQDLFYDGENIDQIKVWLKSECGEPVSLIRYLYDDECHDFLKKGYFVDHFH
ncbi:hypothetical protein [Paenibacillus kandeliae]|uniref:hypothetical protein n=1 Tax=Paenibacillus kandeliae TaxID=3231269 RepID=UPI00345A18B7